MADSTTLSRESQPGECESFWIVSGPPFDQRDYMISPSDSSFESTRKSTSILTKPLQGPCGVRVDAKYILDSRGALQKTVELIRGGHAQMFLTRIRDLITKYLSGCGEGFFLDDLPLVVEILEFFSKNKDSNSEFCGFVKDLVCAARNPPIVTKNSDVLRCRQVLIDYFTVLGEMLATFEDQSIQLGLLDVIESLIFKRKAYNEIAIKISVCQEFIKESQLPYVLAVLIETVSQDLYNRYLDVIIQIILVSPQSGYTMICSNVLNFLLWRLNYGATCSLSFENPKTIEEEIVLKDYYSLLEKSSYAIWSLLTIIINCNDAFPCPEDDAFLSIRIVFERESMKKSQKALCMRNNLAGILVRLSSVFVENIPFFESGIAVDVAVMAVATEMGGQGTWVETCKLGTKKEDFMLKKMMILECCLMAKKKDCLETLKSFRVIEGLLQLLDPSSSAPWIPSQFITLFYTSLRCLSVLVPLLPQIFVLNGGTLRLLSAMKWFMKKNYDREALLEILKTISIIVNGDHVTCLLDDIVAQGGVKVLLDLSLYLLNLESLKLEDQEKLTRIFMVLEKILKNKEKLLIEHENACTYLSINMLKRILKNSIQDSKWNPQFMVSFGGFIWECIAWCPTSRVSFIDQGGIYLLLDLIEVTSYPAQILYLGILVDMTNDGKSVSQLTTWRGKNGYGSLDIMIDIWRKEEGLMKVARTKKGIIQDLNMPLMTQEQWYLYHQVRGSHKYSPSVAEMICSVRPKIYAVYQFLRKRYSDLTSLSESFFSLYLNKVRPSYRIYLPLVEHFLTLKMGEIWFEVVKDMTTSGVVPTADDGEALCTLLDEKNKWSTRIKTMQEEISLFQQHGSSREEKQLYELLKSNRLSLSLEALGELDYVARTSVKKFQLEKKKKQSDDVEKSLRSLTTSPDPNIHRTFISGQNTTCFFGTYMKVKSEKEVVEEEDLEIISLGEPEDNHFEYDAI